MTPEYKLIAEFVKKNYYYADPLPGGGEAVLDPMTVVSIEVLANPLFDDDAQRGAQAGDFRVSDELIQSILRVSPDGGIHCVWSNGSNA